MTIDLTSIANAVIALIAAIITAFVIPWIRSKTTAAQFEKIKMWVTVAVEAAEQLYTGSGRGAEKKAYVVEFLNSKGFKIDAETLDKLIEAAVFNLPDYFTISGIPADTDSNKEELTARRIALPLSAFRRIKNNPPCGLSSLARGIFLFGSFLRRFDRRFRRRGGFPFNELIQLLTADRNSLE